MDEIDVGEAGASLRYWQAKEALRQAELRLASQAASLLAFESRATALLGWVVVAVSTLAGAVIVSIDRHEAGRAAALALGVAPALIAALAASRVIWPKAWAVAGYEPRYALDPCENELQQIEYFVAGYAAGIARNTDWLDRSGSIIRTAWWALLAAPLTAGIGAALTWAAGV